jgi:hypothetical protein
MMGRASKWRAWSPLIIVLAIVVVGAVVTHHTSDRASAAFCSTMRQVLGPDGAALAASVTPSSGNNAPTFAQHQLASRLERDLGRAMREGTPASLARWVDDYQIRLKLSPDQTQLVNAVDRFRAFSRAPLKIACPGLS